MNKNRLRNYMEDLVWKNIDHILRDINMCTCEKCKLDIAAIALNDLPPKYIVTEDGELYTKLNMLEHQFEVDIYTAIIKGAVITKNNPKH